MKSMFKLRKGEHLVDLIVRDRDGKLIYWTTRKHTARTQRGLARVHERLSWEMFATFGNAGTVTVKEA